ncbi:MAG: NAD(P)-dependent alcohol dehydrogenase [Promethearchaeota archaeon]
MRAIIQTKNGPPDVLQLQEVEKPTPADNEVLIKIYAGTVTIGDTILRGLRIPGFLWFLLQIIGFPPRKKIPGHEVAGEIEAVGKNVKLFRKGDQVFGTTTGLTNGGNAEYVCLPEEWKEGVLAIKPTNISYAEAAVIPIGGMTALHILQKGNIQNGNKVLIYGASGSVGTFAVQIAKYFGAEVTGVCSTTNLDLVRSLGANEVIDYTQEDFTEREDTYDVIFDAVGKITKKRYKYSLKKKGVFLSVKSSTSETKEKLAFLKELTEAGKLRSVIDRHYPLEQTAEAHRYVDKGHKKGNVVIDVVPKPR